MSRKGQVLTIQMQGSVKTLEEAFREFVQYGKAKNLSEYTIIYYERYFKEFKGYLLLSIKK